ncbi:cell division protein ZapA [Amorphus orientalis]|uniref:Cell division protein ZapA n=1 Tax=Amorphus orientalis TaxID=649198 RepID=A0AAE3VRR1_9HYPH|nr:cell division protein ZapA [Amorphus orientalis]MDQ0316985.1 cell division protein ZapA [Amorphus orientalis]
MSHITVLINGRTYRMACDDGEEERLASLAERFDAAISELRDAFGEIGDQRLTVMAGIKVSDALAEAERRIVALNAEVESLKESRDALLQHQHEREGAIADRVGGVAQQIDAFAKSLNTSVRTDHDE